MAIRPTTPRRRRGERPEKIPPLSLVLGYGPMAVLPLAAMLAAALPPELAMSVLRAAQLWAGGILMFVGGVRRGLSFDRPERRRGQVALALAYFGIGLIAPILWFGPSFVLLAIGYALMGIFDRRAALRGDAPAHFARLRPTQAILAIAGLAALTVRFLLIL